MLTSSVLAFADVVNRSSDGYAAGRIVGRFLILVVIVYALYRWRRSARDD